MPNKNKKKNSFYFFMVEMKEKEAAKGRTVTMKTLPNLAHPIWAKMSLAEREPYEEKARQHKNDPNLRGGKLQSDGIRVEDYLREHQEVELRETRMQSEIRMFLNVNNCDERQFIEEAPKKMLYFISFNILCQTEDTDGTKEYIPNEVAIIEYSVQHGIHQYYHKFIHPGYIPKGCAADALQNCADKHGIDPYTSVDNSERNMKVVFDAIKQFITSSEGYIPPLFCNEEDIEQTKGCLKWLAKRAGDSFYIRGEEIYKVWNSVYLLLELRSGTGHSLPSIHIARDLFAKTCFNYHPIARCAYHDEKDIHYCALAYSKRLCWLLSDAVCDQFGVEITERHVPAQHSADGAGYVITKANTSARRGPVAALPPRLDKRNNYYQNGVGRGDGRGDQFVQAPVQPQSLSVAPQLQPAIPRQPRQPATNCIAAQMAMLKMNTNAVAAVPGVGIGRGQPRRN